MNTSYNINVVLIFEVWTLILILGTILVFVFQKRSAAFRHGIWCTTMVALLAFPFLFPYMSPLFVTGTSDVSALESVWDRLNSKPIENTGITPPRIVKSDHALFQNEPNLPKSNPVNDNTGKAQQVVARWGGVSASSSNGLSFSFFIITGLLVVYLLGMIIVTLRLLVAHFAAWRWVRTSQRIDSQELWETMRRLGRNIGYLGKIRLLRHSKAVVPFHVSLLWPSVILPNDYSNWSQEELEGVLAHEIAHVARRDLFWQLLMQWASILLWPHPLFWYARHRMRIEQERACDDIVLKTSDRPENYAETLLDMAASLDARAFPALSVVAPIARTGSVADRIARLLNPTLDHRPMKVVTKCVFVALALAALAFGIMAARHPDESQRLYAISILSGGPNVPVRGKVVLPDGSSPEECYVSFHSRSYHKRDDFIHGKRCLGTGGNSGSKHLESGERFDFQAEPGSNCILTAMTHVRGSSFGNSISTRAGGYESRDEVFVATPYSFAPAAGDEEIVLQLEPAIFLTGTLRYENGDPAPQTNVSATYFYEAARGADIPTVQNESQVGSGASTDDEGKFEIPLWPGEFVITAGGTRWSQPVTKIVQVRRGEKTRVELTIPTPLRLTVEVPEECVTQDFVLTHLGSYAPSWSQHSTWREVFFDRIYNVYYWDEKCPPPMPKQPFAVSLSPDKNYVAVMTGDNRYGIVQQVAPEMMGREMTLELKPTLPGKARILSHKDRKPLANEYVTVNLRVMHLERNGSYTLQSGPFGRSLSFQTDAEGNLEFLVPAFMGEFDKLFLCFEKGKGGSGTHGETHRIANLFPQNLTGNFRNFQPSPDAKTLDLGDVELER